MTTKSIIWNQLKALGYESKKLKADYEVSYQQASLSLLEGILEQLQGGGVNESLGSQCGGVTVATVKNSEVPVNYKGFTYNPKNQQVTMNDILIGRCLPDNFITAIDNGWFNIISLCVNELSCKLPEITEDNVATVTNDNKFKGISVEHFNFKHEAYIDSVIKDTSGVLISKYLGTHAISFNDGEQRKSDITLLEAVKLAKQWLGVKQQQVPSTEEAIQPSNLERQQIIEEYHKYRKQRQAIKRTLHRLELKSIYGYSPI